MLKVVRAFDNSMFTSASAKAQVDLFSWLFQDFLPVFAVGNFGANLVDGTIASPSTAKNCIAVGALLQLQLQIPIGTVHVQMLP